MFPLEAKLPMQNIMPGVLESIRSIASEISVEVRRFAGSQQDAYSRSVTWNKWQKFSKRLVLHQFFGYGENKPNPLLPVMDETVKELSTIDDAVVRCGDDVIEPAGALISTPEHNMVMPSGCETRHAAAAAISWPIECIAIAVSRSTCHVTPFQKW
jgi:hypothetical protein